jgi:hypothetical protein
MCSDPNFKGNCVWKPYLGPALCERNLQDLPELYVLSHILLLKKEEELTNASFFSSGGNGISSIGGDKGLDWCIGYDDPFCRGSHIYITFPGHADLATVFYEFFFTRFFCSFETMGLTVNSKSMITL